MKYILDTSILTEIVKPTPADQVIAWIKDNATSCYTSVVSYKEFYSHVLALQDSGKKEALIKQLDTLWLRDADKVLPFDAQAAAACSKLHYNAEMTGSKIRQEQLMIAAIAQRNDATVVSLDEGCYEAIGVSNLNPRRQVH